MRAVGSRLVVFLGALCGDAGGSGSGWLRRYALVLSSPDLVAVPGGQVALTDRHTRRRWLVGVGPIEVARCPVTQAEYAEVTGHRPAAVHDDRLPVEGVSWWDAVSYCAALSEQQDLEPVYRVVEDGVVCDGSAHGYRLLTEAEWEI